MHAINDLAVSSAATKDRADENDAARIGAWRQLISSRNFDAAEKAILHHLSDVPNDVDAMEDLGVVLARQGRFEEAAARFCSAASIAPTRAGTWRNLAKAYVDSGRRQEAVPCLLKAIELDPQSASAYRALAKIYRIQAKHAAAITALEKAISLDPDSAALHTELGRALAGAKRHGEAKSAFLVALKLNREIPNLHNDLGVACHELGQCEEAVQWYEKALQGGLYPARIWNNLGNALRALGRNQQAIDALKNAIELKPEYPEAFNNIAVTYAQMGECTEAIAWYDKAICFAPDYAECHMNRALQHLLLGDYANGWADYEWRFNLKMMRPRELKKPLWDGSRLAGKTILTYWEQGLGDSIQFIRYARELKDRGARVIFEGQPALGHILERTPGIDQFVPWGGQLPSFDVHAPLLSLPGQFGTTVETIPADVPYIMPDPYFVNLWKPRLDTLKGFRVGIVWQGNPKHGADHLRSIPLQMFEPLAKLKGVTLVSVQKNYGVEQLARIAGRFDVVAFDVIDGETDGFLRTAAIIKNLDLVITADTSVAHLAGAMGAEVWIAIATACDWRWLRDREDSPWYPTARLFRQSQPGDWAEVFRRLTDALKERLKSVSERSVLVSLDDRRRAKALVSQAAALRADQVPAKVRALLEQAVGIDPACAEAHVDLGIAHGCAGQPGLAIACFSRALKIGPGVAGTHANLGVALLQNEQFEESIVRLRKAVRLGGGSAEVYNHLGIALAKVADMAAAETCYNKALRLRPHFAAAHCNLGRALVSQGKFSAGWRELEWRWKLAPNMRRRFSQPRWAGEALSHRTILLWAEAGMGVGQVIQFLRYAALLNLRGARVVVECPATVVELALRSAGVNQAVATGAPLPNFDVHAPLMSMPAVVGTTLNTIPVAPKPLNADRAVSARWEQRMETLEGYKVGIAGQPDVRLDPACPNGVRPETFRLVTGIAGVQFINLQTGPAAERGRIPGVVDLIEENAPDLSSMLMELAAIIPHLDLIVTVDTLIAHLAGAIGVPVWLALGKSPGFHWLLDREDCPWYPSVRLFRQGQRDTWDHVFARIADQLRGKTFSRVERATESATD